MSAAANGLRKLAANLREVAGGAVAERVLDLVVDQIRAVANSKVGKHVDTGFAASNTLVRRDARGAELSFPRYLGFHRGWWPFARGIPPFIRTRAAKLLGTLTAAAIAGESSGGGASAGIDAALEAQGAAKAAKKKASETRRAERAYDRRVKAREAREG